MANGNRNLDALPTGGEIRCESVDETIALGEALAGQLSGGEVLSLEGPLGAGKTHFVKGLARGLGFSGTVSSPTFTLVHEYNGGRFSLIHFDLYRLEREDDVIALGYDDYFDGGGIVAIEWGDRFPGLIPPGAWVLRIAIDGGARVITRDVAP